MNRISLNNSNIGIKYIRCVAAIIYCKKYVQIVDGRI
jgi:hypothetical protein